MISELFAKLKAAVGSTDETQDNASSYDRREVAYINEARTDEDRWRIARRGR